MRRVLILALVLACVPRAGVSRTRVAVIGVGDYTGNALTKPVKFAENDARNFGVFAVQKTLDPSPLILTSPIIDYQLNGMAMKSKVASLPTVENELTGLFAQAETQDTVYIFISSRGIARPGLDGYIGTANTVGEKPESGGLPLRFLKRLIEGSHAGRVIIFADVSRKPPETLANNINRRVVAELGVIPKIAGVLATQPGQFSEERDDPKPGQGFFGYYLVNSGIAGTMGVAGVYSSVRQGLEGDRTTKGKQKPADFGSAPAKMGPLWRAFLDSVPAKPRILLASTSWFTGLLAFQSPPQAPSGGPRAEVRKELESSARVADPQAFAKKVQDLSAQLPGEESQELQSLAVEKLAGDAQRAVDRYGMQNLLPDDPLRVTPQDFKAASEEFKAAIELLPSSSNALREELTVRQLLCEGLSGSAIVLDPLKKAHDSTAVIPEVHNAMGIYYLESAKDYDRAIGEFRDAKQLSPGWMYPRHNLALALIERGDYAAAESEYRQAIASQPLQPYVYYNLGLLLHRLNRKSEAKAAYEQALKSYRDTVKELGTRAADWQTRWPEDAADARHRMDLYNTNSADVLNAWGILLASGRNLEARVKYYTALRINQDLCAARDNWAQLEQSMEERADPKAVSKGALSLLDTNLDRPACATFQPSRLQRAKLRRETGDFAGARDDFDKVAPSNTEALKGMASIDSAEGKFESAIQLLKKAVAIEAVSGGVYPDVYVQMAEVYRQSKDPGACRESYDKAISAARGAVYDVSTKQLRNRSARCDQPGNFK